MQDVECRQPHGKKVPTIAEQLPPPSATADEPLLRTALKRSASALKADGVPFALGGGYALWVAGGPEPSHDVDLVVAETDVELAANSLAAAGLRIERPPEDWLFKAYCEDDDATESVAEPALVDVLHRLGGIPVTESLLDTAREYEVLGVRIPVLPPTPIMIAKLQSLSEHYSDFAALLLVVRAVREQLDWTEIRQATQDNPFAEAFLLLVERLGIATPP
ncbi:MAG TPA: nucleotidyltransferase [Propionibacteriaceae bacterium]|nr:nucleotidyltransferase [Propionibacteriaceae bacterium]